MEKIEFTLNNQSKIINYFVSPVITLNKLHIHTEKTDWFKFFSAGIISVYTIAYDEADNVVMNVQSPPISIGSKVDPYSKEPILDIREVITFINNHIIDGLDRCVKWGVKIEIQNIELSANETITLDFVDSNYIKKRVDDWQARVEQLYSTITSWISDDHTMTMVQTQLESMHEELMINYNVKPIDIRGFSLLKNDKLIASIKPYGLWIIGANGRVDMLTVKGNFSIIDQAQSLQDSRWVLFHSNNNNSKQELTRDSFINALGI